MVESKPENRWQGACIVQKNAYEKIVDLETKGPKLFNNLMYHCFYMFVTIITELIITNGIQLYVSWINVIYHQTCPWTCMMSAKPCPAYVARKTRSAYELLNFVQHVREAPGLFRLFKGTWWNMFAFESLKFQFTPESIFESMDPWGFLTFAESRAGLSDCHP
jgi:hypothetical protein